MNISVARTAAVLVAITLALVLASESRPREEVVLIPLDSCSFEVSRELVEKGLIAGVVVSPGDLAVFDTGTDRVAVLASYPPEREQLEFVLGELSRRGIQGVHASSDLLEIPSDRVVASADIRAWCERRDEEALARVGDALAWDSWLHLAIPALVVGGAASIAVLGSHASGFAKAALERLREIPAIVALLAVRLRRRGRLEEREIVGHPLRATILGILKKSPATFTDLQRELRVGRAVLEWHLGVLKAYGVVTEERNGKSRLYRLSEDYDDL